MQSARSAARFRAIPAPYLARATCVSIEGLRDGPEWREVKPWLGHAYDLVRAGLPKRVQAGLPNRGGG
jgi:predicted DNA-binding protein (MmcQ/YjbR family)